MGGYATQGLESTQGTQATQPMTGEVSQPPFQSPMGGPSQDYGGFQSQGEPGGFQSQGFQSQEGLGTQSYGTQGLDADSQSQSTQQYGGMMTQVRQTPSWPRIWANFSLLWLYSHRTARANSHLMGQPNTFLALAMRGGR